MGKFEGLNRQGGANAAASMRRPPAGAMTHEANPSAAARKPRRIDGMTRDQDAIVVELDRIASDPDQARGDFDEESLGRLAESLRTKGQLQPIRVRWEEEAGVYRILCGERRWRAARMAGLSTLKCVVHERPLDDDERLEIQLVENALRDDLKPVEQGRAFRKIMDRRGWTATRLAEGLSVTNACVSRALSLLDLPEEAQALVDAGQLGPTIASEVLKAPPEMQADLADRAVHGGLKRDEVRDIARRAAKGGQGRPRTHAAKVTSRTLRSKYGPRVTFDYGRGLSDEMIRRVIEEFYLEHVAAYKASA